MVHESVAKVYGVLTDYDLFYEEQEQTNVL